MKENIYPMGIKKGSVTRITSRAGYGSTTLALELISIIINANNNSTVTIFDQEQGMSNNRLLKIIPNELIERTSSKIALIHSVTDMYVKQCIKDVIRSPKKYDTHNIIMIDSLAICESLLSDEYLTMLEHDVEDTNIIIIFTDHQICKLANIDRGSDVQQYYETRSSHIFSNDILLTKADRNDVKMTRNGVSVELTRDKEHLFNKEQLIELV